MEACFKAFDKDGDLNLNINEFSELLKALFRNEKGKPYPVDPQMCNELFLIFNQSGDGSLSKQEFAFCWNNWIKKIVRPTSAFLVIDVQNDFISGNLSIAKCEAKHNGEEIVEPINKLLETVAFDVVAYSLDWHPSDHISFACNIVKRNLHNSSPIQDAQTAQVGDKVVFSGPPLTEQILWPVHCVQETWGAELHENLKVVSNSHMVKKGLNPNIDSYSAFFDNQKLGHTEMEEMLRSQNVTDVFICGIAYDVCVASTARDAQELGFRTILVEDCTRGIEMNAIREKRQMILDNNGIVVDSSQVKALVQGKDRPLSLGYQWALQCRKQIFYPPKNKNSRYNDPSHVNNNGSNVATVPPSSSTEQTA